MEEKKENKIQIILFWIISAIFLFATLLSAIRIRYGNVAQFITYGLATICMCPSTISFINKKISKNIKWYIQIIVTIIIIAVGSLFFGDIQTIETVANKVITSENYEQLMEEWENELSGKKTDDFYYFTYAVTYYSVKDGLSSIFNQDNIEEAIFINVYGKTIQQLINEGKTLMKEDNITLKEYKQKLENTQEKNISNKENEKINIYNINETVSCKKSSGEEYTIEINKVTEMNKRNQFSDINPAQVFLIDYTYKNISGKDLYISDMDFQIVDELGEIGGSYPNSISNYPKSTPQGATCKAQMVLYVNNKSHKITLTYKDNMFSNKADFKFEINI